MRWELQAATGPQPFAGRTRTSRVSVKPTLKAGEKMPSTAAPPNTPPGLLHPQIERIEILPSAIDLGCSLATTMSCCTVCCKLTFKTELDF